MQTKHRRTRVCLQALYFLLISSPFLANVKRKNSSEEEWGVRSCILCGTSLIYRNARSPIIIYKLLMIIASDGRRCIHIFSIFCITMKMSKIICKEHAIRKISLLLMRSYEHHQHHYIRGDRGAIVSLLSLFVDNLGRKMRIVSDSAPIQGSVITQETILLSHMGVKSWRRTVDSFLSQLSQGSDCQYLARQGLGY